jgi:hypothetical protein
VLWYKAWLETRWRFLGGFALLVCSAFGTVLFYPKVVQLLPLVPGAGVSGELAERGRESAELARTFRGYIWSQWFRQNLLHMWTVFAVLLGAGGLLRQPGALFTLSMPVSRARLVAVRTATGLGQLFVLALLPSLIVPLASPAVGSSYSVGEALAHAACLFIVGSVFFSLTVLASTIFEDIWRPLVAVFAVAAVLGTVESVSRGGAGYGVFASMSGERYFRTGELPWAAFAVSIAVSAAAILMARANFERHDF